MKRMAAAVVLLAASLGLCFAGSHVTARLTNQLDGTLSDARTAALQNDRKTAYRLSLQAKKDWENAHETLCTFQPHSRLESVDQTLATLPDLAKAENLEQFASECARGEVLAKNLREGELPLLQNIL
ncbi:MULTISPECIES: DUF4363 family protein [Caproicibacterium]|uniref:DUF4363 family protein n=1 Tax=Caproicibacterium argilliputei TaxID=3030016 RepID=A0AA97DB07_9FIRM|nr:DUF4363 family protein [Caproicibacterium argilliputei]WOC33544.1 DUF4363 family protein [Caproicibacterium argilliputei]